MLISDGAQLIRVPVDGIRFASRASKCVRIFKTADGEKVVSTSLQLLQAGMKVTPVPEEENAEVGMRNAER